MSGEEVAFNSEGCVIAGALTEAAAPVAAALLISRSAPGGICGGITPSSRRLSLP
jgi:hypothetical protein